MNTPAFEHPVRIYWEDTDAGGIVFYANYLKFFERARTEWLRHLGVEQQALRQATGGMFVVSETQIKYHRPAQLDDLLRVTARMGEAGRASLVIAQQAWRDKTLLCEGSIRIGWVEAATLKPARIPSYVLERLSLIKIFQLSLCCSMPAGWCKWLWRCCWVCPSPVGRRFFAKFSRSNASKPSTKVSSVIFGRAPA